MSNVGLNTEILDGKLSPRVSLPEDVTLVIDRSTSGTSDQVFLVTDADSAKLAFGSSSPLIQGMRHAYSGGAKNVALYRIGGSASVIENIFGEDTSIRTTSQKVGAGEDLKLYVGPRTEGDTVNVVIVKDTSGRTVFSNVPGRKLDLGVVELDGFDAENVPFTIGTLSAFVDFNKVADTLKSVKGVETVSPRSKSKTLTLQHKYDTVTKVIVEGAGSKTLEVTTDYTVGTSANGRTTIILTNDADTSAVYSVYVESATVGQDFKVVYSPAKDSLNVKLNTLYELFDKAFLNLEAIDVSSIILPDLFNVNNLADGYDGNEDCLTYVTRTEKEDGYEYEWSDIKTIYKSSKTTEGYTTDVAKADLDDLGTPVVIKSYNEVDFAHRLGTWAWLQSSSSTYVNGNIGVKRPRSTSRLAINRWVGSLPTKNEYGNIIVNGTGLLGNRFMSGTSNRKAGFYATDNGYPDGTPRTDSSGVIIDIGRYLSIAPMPVYIANDVYAVSPIPIRSSAAAYSGLVTTIEPGNSTTNQVLPGVVALFKLKPGQIKALSSAGYVALEEKAKGLTVYSGDLATQSESDFDYVSSAIAVAYTLKRLRDVVEPYIGRGLSQTLMAALYNAIDQELKSAISAGYINGFHFNLISQTANELALPIQLQAKDELRAINMTLSLEENQLFSV